MRERDGEYLRDVIFPVHKIVICCIVLEQEERRGGRERRSVCYLQRLEAYVCITKVICIHSLHEYYGEDDAYSLYCYCYIYYSSGEKSVKQVGLPAKFN